jgi:hypothetical protein
MAETSDFKIIVAMNKDLEMGVALNAACHISLGLMHRVATEYPEQAAVLEFQKYRTSDGIELPCISARSLIVLRGKNGELRKLLQEIKALAVPHVSFVESMTQDTYKDQLARTAQAAFQDIPIFGVACLAQKGAIDPLTRRLSLWR